MLLCSANSANVPQKCQKTAKPDKIDSTKFSFRVLWFIWFCFAIYYGYLLYTPFLDTWYNEPTLIAIDQTDFRVEKIPFPAITICSNNKIVYRQLQSVLRHKQPWKSLNKKNYNITQQTTDKGMFSHL